MAFPGDVHTTTVPERTQQAHNNVWNSGGERPEFCDVLQRIAQAADPEARVLTKDQGSRVLGRHWGTPIG